MPPINSATHSKRELAAYVGRQLGQFFPDDNDNGTELLAHTQEAFERTRYSIDHVKLPGYTNFSFLHSDLYSKFLYFLSNTVWRNTGERDLATKLFYLNKALNGINCMFDTQLPDVFLFIHSSGIVLGKATYGNYFVACQNVTVGSDRGAQPTLGQGLYLGPRSAIVGLCRVGNNVSLAMNATLRNQDAGDNVVAIGSSPHVVFKKSKRSIAMDVYFREK